MPVHKHIRRIREGEAKMSGSSSSTSGSSHATISEDSSLEGTLRASSQPHKEKYPVGTRVKKYFNGHGWCSGEIISASKGHYKVRYERGFELVGSAAPAAKDYSYRESDMKRLTKTANVELGSRVDIFWPREKRYFTATVQKERPRKRENFLISYDTKSAAEREWIDLGRHKFKVLPTIKPAPHPKEVVVLKHQNENNDRSLKDGYARGEQHRPEIVERNASSSSGEAKVETEPGNDRNDTVSPQLLLSSQTSAVLVDQSDTPKSQESASSSAFSVVLPGAPDLNDSDSIKSPAVRMVSDVDPLSKVEPNEEPTPDKAFDETHDDESRQHEGLIPADSKDDMHSDDEEEEEEEEEEEGVVFDPENDAGTRSLVSSLVDVGSRVAVYWEDDKRYYSGTVTDRRLRGKPFYLVYDDGEEEWIDLRKHKFRLLSRGSSERESDVARRNRRLRQVKDEDSARMPLPARRISQKDSSDADEDNSKSSALKRTLSDDASGGGSKRKKLAENMDDEDTGSEDEIDDFSRNGRSRIRIKKQKKFARNSDERDIAGDIETDESDNDVASQGGKVESVVDDDIAKIAVGSRVAIWWDGDKQFYDCTVTKKRSHKKPFYVVYDDGEAEEWVDFRKQRFKLLPNAPPEKKKRGRPKKEERIGRPEDVAKIKIGARVAVWWSSVSQYYEGTITQKRSGDKPFFLDYDGDETGHWIDFTKHTFKFLGRNTKNISSPAKKKQKVSQTKKTKERLKSEEKVPEITVGTRVAVYWEGDAKYYTGVVTRERPNSKKRFYLEYDDGEAAHWIDFQEHWVRVLRDKSKSSKKSENSKYSSKPNRSGKKSAKKATDLSKIKVGSRIAVWWPGDECYYNGTVVRAGAQDSRFFFAYDDGDEEWINFRSHSFRLLHESDDNAEQSGAESALVDTDGEAENKESEDDKSDGDEASVEESDEEDHLAYDDFVYGAVDTVGVGSRLSIWWSSEKKYFDGTVKKIDDSRKPYFVVYDDGDKEWTDLKRRYFRFID